jgi:OLD-like protein
MTSSGPENGAGPAPPRCETGPVRTSGPGDQLLAPAAAAVLVEGASDQAALTTLAVRRGRDLAGEGVVVVPMGGATNIGHFLEVFGPRGFGVRLAGLCDEGEEPAFRRGLERAGLAPGPGRSGLERLGFFVCVTDLEDELIRSLGVAATEQLIGEQGELGSFRTFAKQPAQRARPRDQQLRRFLGTRSGRKIRYRPGRGRRTWAGPRPSAARRQRRRRWLAAPSAGRRRLASRT